MYIQKIIFLVIICLSVSCSTFQLQEGDLIFQDLDCGPMCEAIEAVTQGIDNYNFSHVGLVISNQDSLYVLEAISAGVVLTPLDEFLSRAIDPNGQPKALVARLKGPYRHLNQEAIAYAKSRLGYPYDDVFLMDNEAYYCSELLYEAYKQANNNTDFFELFPMTFKPVDSADFFPVWESYYSELSTPIPEGEPGLNPGGMSISDKIEIVHQYGEISRK